MCQADLRNPHFGYQAFDNFGMNSLTVFQVCGDDPPITLQARPSNELTAGRVGQPIVCLPPFAIIQDSRAERPVGLVPRRS